MTKKKTTVMTINGEHISEQMKEEVDNLYKNNVLKEAVQVIINECFTRTTQQHKDKEFCLGCPECQMFALIYLLKEFKKIYE